MIAQNWTSKPFLDGVLLTITNGDDAAYLSLDQLRELVRAAERRHLRVWDRDADAAYRGRPVLKCYDLDSLGGE